MLENNFDSWSKSVTVATDNSSILKVHYEHDTNGICGIDLPLYVLLMNNT